MVCLNGICMGKTRIFRVLDKNSGKYGIGIGMVVVSFGLVERWYGIGRVLVWFGRALVW